MLNCKNVAIYCRVASENQLVLKAQEENLLLYAKENGLDKYDIIIYSDNGYSGMNFNRPAFSLLEEGIQIGVIGVVLVRDLTRIGREHLKTSDWLHKIRNSGVVFVEANLSLTENLMRNIGCFGNFIGGGADYEYKYHTDRKICRAALG